MYRLILFPQALPRLTNRQKLVQMVDPALKGQFALKDLIQVVLSNATLPSITHLL